MSFWSKSENSFINFEPPKDAWRFGKEYIEILVAIFVSDAYLKQEKNKTLEDSDKS